MQGLPCESYILTSNRLDAVVFFNGGGNERQMWKEFTGGNLTEQFIEGAHYLFPHSQAQD